MTAATMAMLVLMRTATTVLMLTILLLIIMLFFQLQRTAQFKLVGHNTPTHKYPTNLW